MASLPEKQVKAVRKILTHEDAIVVPSQSGGNNCINVVFRLEPDKSLRWRLSPVSAKPEGLPSIKHGGC